MNKTMSIRVRGITSLEAVIGVTIAATVLVYGMYAVNTFVNNARTVTEKTQALYLAEDGLELLRYLRDEDWANISGFSTNGTHYLRVTTTTVQTTNTPETIDGYSRSFTVRNVYRDSLSDDVVASTTGGSVADTGAKYVTVTVTWGVPTQSVSLSSILADIGL